MSIQEIVTLLIAAIGVFFLATAAIGMMRMPDIYTRLHAGGKAGTLGVICVLLGVALHFASFGIIARMIALIAFFLITAPVAAHMLDRAALLTGVQPVEGTFPNELAGKYDRSSRRLASMDGKVAESGD